MKRLRVWYGPMTSGKTHELLKHAHLLSPSFPSHLVAKPSLDTREACISSRTGLRLPVSQSVPSPSTLPLQPRTLYVLDEVQFFPAADLLAFAQALALTQPTSALLAAGLDLDFARQPFGGTLALAAQAAALPAAQGAAQCLSARCCAPGCTAPAPYTQRLSAGGHATVVVGGADLYRPACPAHHSPYPIDGSGWAQ